VEKRNKDGTFKSASQLNSELNTLLEKKRQKRLLNKLDVAVMRFKRLFPKGKVTMSWLWGYYNPPIVLFDLFLPDKLKMARQEGAEYVAKRFVQRPDISFSQFRAWKHDQLSAHHRRSYRALMRDSDPFSAHGVQEEFLRYHRYMLKVFVREFNKNKPKKKREPIELPSPMRIGNAIPILQAGAETTIRTHLIKDGNEQTGGV